MSHEAPKAMEAIEAHQDAGLEEHELASVRMTIDLDAETSTCPACMGIIPQGSMRCPGCGLRIG